MNAQVREGSGSQASDPPITTLAAYLAFHQVPPVECFLCSILGDEKMGCWVGSLLAPTLLPPSTAPVWLTRLPSLPRRRAASV